MKVEFYGSQFKVDFSKEELINMAISMQKKLKDKLIHIQLDECLDIVSSQFGYTYQQIVDIFEDIDYQHKKYLLKDNWTKQFLAMGFPGWSTAISYHYEDQLDENNEKYEIRYDFYSYEAFGHSFGVRDDLDTIYEEMWSYLIELLSIENTLIPFIDFKEKEKLEKYILQNLSPQQLAPSLKNINETMARLPEEVKTTLLNNIQYHYLPKSVENIDLYQNKVVEKVSL